MRTVFLSEEEEEEEEEHFSAVVIGSTIFGIVTLLIAVTIAFEAIQDRFVHRSPKYMRPMVSCYSLRHSLPLASFSNDHANIIVFVDIIVISRNDSSRIFIDYVVFD